MADKVSFNGYDLRTALAFILPNYSIDQDQEGQIIIYTGLTETVDDTYIPMKREG